MMETAPSWPPADMEIIPKIEPEDDYSTPAEEVEIKQEIFSFETVMMEDSTNISCSLPNGAEQTRREPLLDAVKVEEDLTAVDDRLDSVFYPPDQIAYNVNHNMVQNQKPDSNAERNHSDFNGKTFDSVNLPAHDDVIIKQEDSVIEMCSNAEHVAEVSLPCLSGDVRKDVVSEQLEDLIWRGKTYSCPHCEFTSDVESYLANHLCKCIKDKVKKFRCTLCTYEAKFESNLIAHMRVHENPFVCSQCDYETDMAEDLGAHIQSHEISNLPKVFKCPLCDFRAYTKVGLEQHSPTHFSSSRKFFACGICKYSCVFKSTFMRHMRTHDVDEELRCDQCSYRTKVKASLATHIASHYADGLNQLCCVHCDFKTNDENILKQHIFQHFDNSVKRYTCPHCNFCADHELQFAIHIRKHDDLFTPVKQHVCNMCPYRTANKSHFTRHLRKHDKNRSKPFVCHLCNYATDDKLYLSIHLRIHNKDRKKTLACSDCDYRTDYKRTLQRHIVNKHRGKVRETVYPWMVNHEKTGIKNNILNTSDSDSMHTSETLSECTSETDYIQTDSSTSAQSFEFSVLHTDKTDSIDAPVTRRHSCEAEHDEFFSCPHCDYTSVNKLEMECHNNVHIDEDMHAFHCHFCSHSSFDKRRFAAHVRRHSKNRILSFFCKICEYKTARKNHLVKHILTHADDNFRCSFCTYSTKDERQLVNHIASHKNIQKNSMSRHNTKNDKLSRHAYQGKLHQATRLKKVEHDEVGLLEHEQGRVDQILCVRKPPRFGCEACDYTTDYRPYIIKHFRSHSCNKKGSGFECPVCLYKAPAQGSLLLHMARHHIKEQEVATPRSKKENFVEIKVEVVDDNAGKNASNVGRIIRDGAVDCIVVDSVEGDVIYVNVVGNNGVQKCVADKRRDSNIALYKPDNDDIDIDSVGDADDLMSSTQDEETIFLFSCNKCKYKTDQLKSFAKHRSKHEVPVDKAYACMDCDFQTDKKHDLALHIRQHMTGRKQRKPQRKKPAVSSS